MDYWLLIYLYHCSANNDVFATVLSGKGLSLLGFKEWKFIQMASACWSRRLPYLYMVKTLWKSSSPEPKNPETWYKALSNQGHQVCYDDDLNLTFDFLMKMSVWLFSAFIWEKYWKVNFQGPLKVVSSPEHEVFMVRYCDRSMSVFCRAASTIYLNDPPP